MHHTLDEICRCQGLPQRLDVFKRWQHELRTDVQCLLDELEARKAAPSRPSRKTETAACA